MVKAVTYVAGSRYVRMPVFLYVLLSLRFAGGHGVKCLRNRISSLNSDGSFCANWQRCFLSTAVDHDIICSPFAFGSLRFLCLGLFGVALARSGGMEKLPTEGDCPAVSSC